VTTGRFCGPPATLSARSAVCQHRALTKQSSRTLVTAWPGACVFLMTCVGGNPLRRNCIPRGPSSQFSAWNAIPARIGYTVEHLLDDSCSGPGGLPTKQSKNAKYTVAPELDCDAHSYLVGADAIDDLLDRHVATWRKAQSVHCLFPAGKNTGGGHRFGVDPLVASGIADLLEDGEAEPDNVG